MWPRRCAWRAGRRLSCATSSLTYHLRRETAIPSDRAGGMARWRKSLFAAMLLNANRSASHCGLPLALVVEVGLEVAI